MSQTVRKASDRAYSKHSAHGQGMGSHSAFQSLVGRLIESVQIADERLGFGQVSSVCSTGVRQGCLPAGRPTTTRPSTRTVSRRMTLAVKATPLPPTPHLALGALPTIFPPFFKLYDNQPKGAFDGV